MRRFLWSEAGDYAPTDLDPDLPQCAGTAAVGCVPWTDISGPLSVCVSTSSAVSFAAGVLQGVESFAEFVAGLLGADLCKPVPFGRRRGVGPDDRSGEALGGLPFGDQGGVEVCD